MPDRNRHLSRRGIRRQLGAVGVVVAVLITGLVTAASPVQGHRAHRQLRPVIFVHGGAGSGAQFESQAMRLTSNGYPADRIAVHEYDSTFATNTMDEVWAGLDQLIADLRAETGADQVDLLGHSLGTTVSHGYLNSSPERAATVAHYVNIDGRTAAAPPGGVDTLAVWGEGDQTRQIVGARNYYAPDQAHVEVATAAETFGQFYEFFTGRRPRTTDIVPERPDRVRISGEANLFPVNSGAVGTTLEIWEVHARTGARRGHRPKATFEIGADGAWGPFRANGRKRYELALVRADGSAHHFYFQPFMRSDHLVRLLTSEPGTGIDLLRDRSDRHASFTVVRYREWWGDQGAANDVLEVEDQSLLNAAIAPRTKRVNALFVFDDGADGVTDLTGPIPDVFSLPFISGADLFVPAATPPDDTVRLEMTARTEDGETEVVNAPNRASSQHHATVQFRDFEQDVERFGQRGRGR
jgi:pimeloyl-ACP methyl ester carboxylesterase